MKPSMIAAIALMAATQAGHAAGTPGIDRAQARQEQRIEQGVQSGELTRPETRRLATQELQLDRHQARVEADGIVTAGERHRLHRDAARSSRHIHRQKHDAQQRH